MPLSIFVTHCALHETPGYGVSENGRLFPWWPRTVTATTRWHFLSRRQLSPASPAGQAGNLCFFSLLCVFISFGALAQDGQDVAEQSGWELSIANGLLLFKREKTVHSQTVDDHSATEEGQSMELSLDSRRQTQHASQIAEPELDEPQIVEELWFMPAVESRFHSDVSGIVARSTVIQTFKNPTHEWLHGTYQFPLPEDAAVDVLKMRIGKREIIGEIQRKQEARKRFAQAKRTGQRASLVEQQKPNMFTTNLANIGPDEEIEIEIQFQQRARFIDGEFRLRFPTTYVPRAMLPGMKPDEESEQDLELSPFLNSQFSASITLNAGSELAYIESPHYPLTTEQSPEFTYSLHLDQPQPGDRDLEINWRYLDPAPKVLHYREASKEGEYGLVMILPGEATQAPDIAREVTFVMDTSSSMAGESVRQAKAALALAVNSLNPSDRFNIIEFNSDAFAFWNAPQPANSLNKSQALNFIQGLQARGGTDIFAALQLSLELQTVRRNSSAWLQQLVFVTDGAIGYEEQLLAEIESQLGDARLFTVGIGAAPNSYFMVEAANVGRGSYTHISQIAQVNTRMSGLLQQLSSPSLTDIKVNFGMDVEMFPARLPDLYHGEPLVLSYLAPQAISALQVEGRRANNLWQQSVELDYWQENKGIAKHWAQGKIRDLNQQKRLIPAVGQEDKDAIVQKITRVALAHQLVSPYTSLIAVEQQVAREPGANPSTQAQRLQQEVLMASMPNTAAGSRQTFALALAALLIAALMSFVSWLNGRTVSLREQEYQQGDRYVSQ